MWYFVGSLVLCQCSGLVDAHDARALEASRPGRRALSLSEFVRYSGDSAPV